MVSMASTATHGEDVNRADIALPCYGCSKWIQPGDPLVYVKDSTGGGRWHSLACARRNQGKPAWRG